MDISKRGEELLISGSDDGYIGIWDPRTKAAVDFIETEFPVTAVALAEAGNELYSGGIDNDIKVWDMRRKAVVYSMLGHTDTISSLRISPDSQSLLSNSMDSTVRTWDIRPFAPTERHIRTFDGAPAGMEKNLIKASWDSNGKKIAAGSGDGTTVIWNSENGKLLYKLPGHKGTVNCAELSPSSDPISKCWQLKSYCNKSNNAFSTLGLFGPQSAPRRAEVRIVTWKLVDTFEWGTVYERRQEKSFEGRFWKSNGPR
jgi:Prp8 binding protein